MKKKHSSRIGPEPRAVEPNSLVESITRFWLTLFIISVILYVSALVISRTAGFRDLVRQQLEMKSGVPLKVEKMHASFGLDLILEGIQEAAVTNRQPGLLIKKAELHWRLLPLIGGKGWPFKRLKLVDPVLRFTQSTDGNWTPLPQLNDVLAPWVEIATTNTAESGNVIHLTDYLRNERAKLEITNLRLVWQSSDENASLLALIEGLDIETAAVRPFSDDFMWFKMNIRRGERNGVEWANGVSLEWIRMPDQDVILKLTGTIKPLSQLSSLYTREVP